MKGFIRSILMGALVFAATGQSALAYGEHDRRGPDHYDRDRDYDRYEPNRPDRRPPHNNGNALCIGVRDSRYGSVSFNEVHARVSNRWECIRHCESVIRWEDINHWRYDYYNMCWYDDGYQKGFIFP